MRYDAIIIGAGQAGVPLAKTLTRRGWKVALAEGEKLGGSCVNHGCTPSKTIIASARAAHLARRGTDFGVVSGPVSVDFAKVMQRAEDVVQRFRGGIEKSFAENENLTVYPHYASFESASHVRAGDEIIESERIYINTGARSATPPIEGLDAVGYLNNVSILDLRTLPDHLIVLGGGYVGLEYAQAFRRLGSEVTLIEQNSQLLVREDADIADAARQILEAEGVRVLVNSQAAKAENTADGVRVTVQSGDRIEQIDGSHLLVALGRKPNTKRLAVEKAGLKTDEKGYITVDDHLRTNVPGIWALGDVNGRGAFTHTSYTEADVVLDNLDGGGRSIADRPVIYAVYIDPPLGRVGMSEKEVRQSGRNALIAELPMSQVSRAIERDETHGLMKVIVDADSGQFLGAAILGIGGDEAIHIIADLMYAKVPYTVLKDAVHIHPTVAELLPTLVGKLKPLGKN